MLSYKLTIHDFHTGNPPKGPNVFRGLSLTAAWRKANKAIRRGHRLYGGPIERSNWGLMAGSISKGVYRRAVISMDRT